MPEANLLDTRIAGCRVPRRSSRPIAIHSSILPIPCIILNPVGTPVLSSPVFACTEPRSVYAACPESRGEPRSAKLQPRPDPPATRSRLVLLVIPVIQPLYFQWLPDSFAQWTRFNPFLSNRFRTLSITMGVYTPPLYLLFAPAPVRSPSAKSTHELRTFSQQILYLPHLRFSWGEGG